MTSSVRVRIASSEDAETIALVINVAFRRAEEFFIDGDRIDAGQVRELLRTGKFLVADEEGIVGGCVYVEPRGDRAYLGLLSVDPSRQRSGLGSSLMDHGEDYCRRLGCKFMNLKIVNLRKEMSAYYRRRGYIETGTSPFPANIETKLPCHFVEMSKPLEPRECKSG
jgi:GNAT superfamily N-acetyltransferase